MQKTKLKSVAAIFFILAASGRTATAQQTLRLLKAGDAAYAEKSYGVALKKYTAIEKCSDLPVARRDEIGLRITLALGRAKQWDQALRHGLAFVKTHRQTVWEPRGLHALAQIYLNAPHDGYRVGSRFYRGDDVPKTQGNDSPVYDDVEEQDTQNAREALEAARVLYDAGASRFRDRSHTRAEEIQLNFDLVRTLAKETSTFNAWAEKKAWLPLNEANWTVNPAAPYNLKMPPPQKARFLFAQIRSLADSQKRAGDTRALSLLGEALWLRQHHKEMAQWARKWDGRKFVRLPYPYEKVQPTQILERLVHDYPNSPVREQAQFLRGTYLDEDGKLPAAMQSFRAFIAARPHSKWVSDARYRIAQIVHRSLSIQNPYSAIGKPKQFRLVSRNVKQVRLTAYRVRLEDVLARRFAPTDGSDSWDSVSGLFGKAWKQRKAGQKVATWSVTMGDRGDYAGRTQSVTLPVRDKGAYLVEASAPGVKATTLAVISDLTLVQKVSPHGTLCYVTDSSSGKPVTGAKVTAWLTINDSRRLQTLHGMTNAEGVVSLSFPAFPNNPTLSLSALATEGNRYALIAPQYVGYGETAEQFKTYAITDRSVYRPQQTVYYRQIVMRRQAGIFAPVVNKPIRILIHDARGKLIHKRIVASNEFGSVSGQCVLPQNAVLGEYQVTTALTKQNASEQNHTFRVEEYKKPEFEVTVLPEATRVRLGQPTHAKIQARYYFGGAVPNAKVTYRVYRAAYAQTYRFPQPFDFLYHAKDNIEEYRQAYRGEVVHQGTARTNAEGEAQIEFPTEVKSDKRDNKYVAGRPQRVEDQTFTIEADVQDASRRVITGSGEVKATQHDVAVFLQYPRGYATQGDQLQVEIRTLNPSDVPVSAAGTAKVLLQPDSPKGQETVVHQEALTTDAQGYALLKWTAAKAGHYRIVFVTQDSANQPVKSSLMVWVDGTELAHGRFLFQSVFLAVKQPYAQEGDTAKVLLVTPAPNCFVLLTREADSEILEKRIVRVPGRSLEIDVPITRRDVPNLHLSVVLVRNGQVYEATQEIFVPPVRQFATVTVQSDKARYEPGEKATLRLHATDWQSRPLRTELSVAVSDAALGYIQKDYASDIRAFVYGDRRSQDVRSNSSTETDFSSYDEDTQRPQQFRVHRWTLPDGMGRLSDWVDPSEEQEFRPRRDPLQVQWSIPPPPNRSYGNGRVSDQAIVLSSPESIRGYSDGYYRTPVASGMGARKARVAMTVNPRIAIGVDRANEEVSITLGGKGLMEATLRSRFADTAFWTPAVVTNTNGDATVEVTFPDNLTQWKADAVGSSATAQVGSGAAQVVTKKDLLVRLQSPRFLVEQDKIVLSANVLNSLPSDARVKVKLDLSGADAEILPDTTASKTTTETTQANGERELWIDVPKDSEKRVDWIVQVRKDGELRVRMTAQSEKAADAAELTLPVLVHGVEKLTVQSGVLRGNQTAQVTVKLPELRKAGTSQLIVQINPSLAAVMLDALPYLADYPYGCIEQTMSRFVPCVVLAKSLKDLGYNLDDLKRRAMHQAEQEQKSVRLPHVANSPYTTPNGSPGDTRFAELSVAAERANSPVFDRQLLQKMTAEGLARIAANQNSDGGWGWWRGSISDPTMSSYVCYGLLLARDAGTKIDPKRLVRGLKFVETVLNDDSDIQAQAYAVRVLAMEPRYHPLLKKIASGALFRRRDQLTPYSKALLALALSACGEKQSGRILLRNLEAIVQKDATNGTAHWDGTGRYSWRWYNNKIETNATILQAYLALQPASEMPALLVKWLVNNRRASIWNSTRETALTVYALAEYIRVKKELRGDHTITVNFDNRTKRTYHITHDNALFFDNRLIVSDELLAKTTLPLSITQTGTGTCYFTASTRSFSQEAQLKATGNEIAVRRRYFRLLPQTAHSVPEPEPLDSARPNPFLTRQYERLQPFGAPTTASDSGTDTLYQRVALHDGEEVHSGELIEVELELESKNDYDYLLFEDIKPAGCEPVDVRSGDVAGKGVYANRELRDQKVAFFLDSLPQGRRTLSYRLRAEMPGQFRSLPVNGYTMYAPDIRALSDEHSLSIRD